MTDDENANIHTVSVSVPDWLKERFDDGLSEYEDEWAAYKKLADTIKNNSFISMTVKDLSDETLDYAATVYSDDWYSIDPWEQQMRLDDIRDWIVALIEGGVVSVSPQSKTEKPFWKPIEECPKEELKTYLIAMKSGNVCTGWYNRENKQWEGDAECYKKSLFAFYAEIPPLEAE